MSKNLNISVLVAARDEYIDQLKCIIVPMLLQGFNSIYQDSLKISEGKRTIWKFQELLKQIPQWNQTILQEESKRIKKKCPYIMDIVTAIFVTNVKILASVRLKGSRDDIRVKIPTSDIFIHSIYIESAQQIFYDPFLFYHRSNKIQENKQHVKRIIEYSVDESIRQMLPFDDILQKYLADALNENAEFGDGSESSYDDSVSDPDEDSINNENLPSDESDYEDSEPGNDVKTFQLGKNNYNENFTPVNDHPINPIGLNEPREPSEASEPSEPDELNENDQRSVELPKFNNVQFEQRAPLQENTNISEPQQFIQRPSSPVQEYKPPPSNTPYSFF
jgi:hypothetical protein